VKLRTSKLRLTMEDRINVPRKGQSRSPCEGGVTEVYRTKTIP
jgi:hypothetical protein